MIFQVKAYITCEKIKRLNNFNNDLHEEELNDFTFGVLQEHFYEDFIHDEIEHTDNVKFYIENINYVITYDVKCSNMNLFQIFIDKYKNNPKLFDINEILIETDYEDNEFYDMLRIKPIIIKDIDLTFLIID